MKFKSTYQSVLITLALAFAETELSDATDNNVCLSSLKTSSLSSPGPNWISSNTAKMAAAPCSSPFPFLKLRSMQSVSVTRLDQKTSIEKQ